MTLRSASNKGSTFAVEVPIAASVPALASLAPRCGRPAAPLEGVVVLCIENEPQVLAGMEALLSGWGCQVLAVPDLESAFAAIQEADRVRMLCWSTTTWTRAMASMRSSRLRRELDDDMPAALITADRSPAVRETARARDIQVFNKPVKPAAMRAFLAQWRVARPAAE